MEVVEFVEVDCEEKNVVSEVVCFGGELGVCYVVFVEVGVYGGNYV